jgi:hypothetical protein
MAAFQYNERVVEALVGSALAPGYDKKHLTPFIFQMESDAFYILKTTVNKV